jgi:hypothetical protein
MSKQYHAKQFNLHGLEGISDRTLEMHMSLYEGYVKATNDLTREISELRQDGAVDQEEMPAYSELTRRLGFEYNGMVLHEYYFDNMRRKATSKEPARDSAFLRSIKESFGGYDQWKTECGEDAGSGMGHLLPTPIRRAHHQSLDFTSRAWKRRRVRSNPRNGCLGACLSSRLCSFETRGVYRRLLCQHRLERRRPANAYRCSASEECRVILPVHPVQRRRLRAVRSFIVAPSLMPL